MTKEEEILLAAEEEFFTNGYDASSTAAIAKRAGVTHAMVNYYFRTKERLFAKILDDHIRELLKGLKALMMEDGDIVEVSVQTALVIFDKLNDNRRLPFLLSDISRTHPEFLLRYKETVDTICKDSIEMHSKRLDQCISNGKASQCTMADIYNTVLALVTAPFLNLPLLQNVAGFTPEQTDSYLLERRAEIAKVLEARYSAGR